MKYIQGWCSALSGVTAKLLGLIEQTEVKHVNLEHPKTFDQNMSEQNLLPSAKQDVLKFYSMKNLETLVFLDSQRKKQRFYGSKPPFRSTAVIKSARKVRKEGRKMWEASCSVAEKSCRNEHQTSMLSQQMHAFRFPGSCHKMTCNAPGRGD